MALRPPLHYQIEPLPDGGMAIWRTSIDGKITYSVMEIMPVAKQEPPPKTGDQLILLLQAMADMERR